MPQIDLSIIIPHWQNVVDLRRLLVSIPDDERFEIIVVDDYSDESCFAGVKDLQKDFRFALLKNNGKKSAGTCRNIGLATARGKWILFADADDFFLDTLKDEFYHHFDSDCDIVFFPPKGVFSDTLEPSTRGQIHAIKIENYIANPCQKTELALRLSWHCPWSKLYSNSFIQKHKIKFDRVIASNDVMFSAISGSKANKIGVSKVALYCATAKHGSLENTVSRQIIEARMRVAINHRNLCSRISAIEYADSALKHYYASRYLRLHEWLILTKLAKKLGVFNDFSLFRFLVRVFQSVQCRLSCNFRRMKNLREISQ